MNFKHFDDVKPNDKAQFEMLYFSAQRALRRLELKLNRIYNAKTFTYRIKTTKTQTHPNGWCVEKQ